MATYYLDFEGGNDANNGTSFAQRWKTIDNGATAARTAPGDTIRIMGSPSPTLIGSAIWPGYDNRPVYSQYAADYIPKSQLINMRVTAATNATPIVLTLEIDMLLTDADLLRVSGFSTNTNANGTWRIKVLSPTTVALYDLDGSPSVGNGSETIVDPAYPTVRVVTTWGVTLLPTVTKSIALCKNARTTWTDTGGTTTSFSTSFPASKLFYNALNIEHTTSATGKLTYFTLPSALNLSGYQQISFIFGGPAQSGTWLSSSAGVTLRLCTDTAGNTPVHTIPLPAFEVDNETIWINYTYDLAGNLNSSIQSIAIYSTVDFAFTIYLDNIIACKASSSNDSLTLNSLISKNYGPYDGWYAPMAIIDSLVILDGAGTGSQYGFPSAVMGYTEPTLDDQLNKVEVINTFKRELIKIPLNSVSPFQFLFTTQEAGTSGSPITFSGGWDRTSMSSQTQETIFDCQQSSFNGLEIAHDYITVDKIGFTKGNFGIVVHQSPSSSVTGVTISGAVMTCNATAIANIAGIGTQVGTDSSPCIITSAGTGIYNTIQPNFWSYSPWINTSSYILGCPTAVSNQPFGTIKASNLVIHGANIGVTLSDNTSGNFTVTNSIQGMLTSQAGSSSNVELGVVQLLNNHFGLIGQGNAQGSIGTLTASGNTTLAKLPPPYLKVRNFSGSTDDLDTISYTSATDLTSFDARFSVDNLNDTGIGYVSSQNGIAMMTTEQRHTGSGYSWRLEPTSALAHQYNPLWFSIAKLPVMDDRIVTVSVWLYRTTSDLTLQLRVPGHQLIGIDDDLIDTCVSVGAWEQVTVSFTTQQRGVVEVLVDAWGTSGGVYGYVDDLTWDQSALSTDVNPSNGNALRRSIYQQWGTGVQPTQRRTFKT